MLYGWVDDQANRLSDDSGWSDVNTDSPVYYLGSWEDGAMKTGWQKITVYDDQEDEDMDHWFYFQSNGKRFQKSSTTTDEYRTKTVNGCLLYTSAQSCTHKEGFDSLTPDAP